jgi:hypothetical protein
LRAIPEDWARVARAMLDIASAPAPVTPPLPRVAPGSSR